MTKNLFLKAKAEDRYYLVVTTHDARVDLHSLRKLLDVRKLSFATAEEMKALLGIDPGSVTIMSLLNDSSKRVTPVIDSVLWNAEETQHHPLVNTSTIVLSNAGLRTFLKSVGHEPNVASIPVA